MAKARSKSKSGEAKRIVTPRYLLVYDAAGAAGIALFIDGQLKATVPADGTRFSTMHSATRALLYDFGALDGEGSRVQVLEQHWMNKMSSKGSMTLGQRRGIAQSAGEACGFNQIFYVPSSTWHSVIFDHKRPDDVKQAGRDFAKARWGVEPLTDDETDAVCLGTYFLQERCHAA